MDPDKQAVLEELEFNFREIQCRQTALDPRIEELITDALGEADVRLTELTGVTDDDILIAHAMIYVINSSLGQLYNNVVQDVIDRLHKRIKNGSPSVRPKEP